jgi:alanine-glyoxylate transaminase/serine-glyoxylate transaminase/serine-pyruvate transaminase
MSRKPGRQFFANPGPTNIPDSVLRAMSHAAVDFNEPSFVELYESCVAGLKRVLRTEHELFMYTASGHGSWEATLTNLFSTGDRLLMVESGYFSEGWTEMAGKYGLVTQTLPADWRRGIDIQQITATLAADREHKIRGVCVVHNETATGLSIPLDQVRAAIDAAGHPALLLVDTISSLGSLDFRMDEWGIDAVVGGSQKGLMLHTGLSFTAASPKAMAAHKQSNIPRYYFDWTSVMARRHRSFVGTIPVSFFFGMQEALRLLEEEGLEQVYARHARLGEATRRAVRTWAGNDGPQLFCTNPSRASNSVTAILMPEGHNAEAVRKTALDRFNVSLGGGLGRLGGKVFRIGHLGDLNEPMILGTLATVEMCLKVNQVPHGAGGVAAAIEYLAAA